MSDLTPHFEDVQSHYDLSDDFYKLFLDPTQTARFTSFVAKEIFPGGQLPTIETVRTHTARAGLTITRTHSLQTHYARTLDIWARSLAAHRDQAIAVQSDEVYQRYIKCLTGCADMFRNRYIDVNQLTLAK